ncbi:ABC transporter, ATP-binding protein [Lunatimonas lonarensis]|uniref:ABC transporter, ATP-binding protein n=1 Tax=Lunatimonas lonarensis TaxID=1232681 RepID=R7ZQG1_9BACT|nr:ABC transporter, ATP-binding protein [Lunatimonas lonarensis]
MEIPSSEIYRQLALSAPYLELPEEFTLIEFLRFHFRFKSLKNGISIEDAVQYMYLEKSTEKTIQHFSSGMKQRLKLGMCFFSACPLLLLDEPTSNLDERGVQWFQGLVADFGNDKSIIVGSNDPREYQFCTEKVAIENFK